MVKLAPLTRLSATTLARMASLSSPPAWRAADDGSERSTKRRLIGEACLKRHLRQGTLRAYE
jgi:hypothetical protein